MVALAVGTLALVGFLVVAAPVSILDAAENAENYARCQTSARSGAADWLEEHAAPGDVFAIGDAGLVPFYAGATTIDVFALNDPIIQETGPLSATVRAQRAIDARPRFFVLASRDGEELRPLYGTDRRIADNPVFEENYELSTVTGTADCDYQLFIYSR